MHNFYLVRFAKSAPNQPICWMLLILKGMHPDMEVMLGAYQSIAMRQKANGMCQQQSSAPWAEAHTIMHHFCPVRVAKPSQN